VEAPSFASTRQKSAQIAVKLQMVEGIEHSRELARVFRVQKQKLFRRAVERFSEVAELQCIEEH